MICRLDFPYFVGVQLYAFSRLSWQFFVVKTIEPPEEAIESGILLQVLYYGVRNWLLS